MCVLSDCAVRIETGSSFSHDYSAFAPPFVWMGGMTYCSSRSVFDSCVKSWQYFRTGRSLTVRWLHWCSSATMWWLLVVTHRYHGLLLMRIRSTARTSWMSCRRPPLMSRYDAEVGRYKTSINALSLTGLYTAYHTIRCQRSTCAENLTEASFRKEPEKKLLRKKTVL